MVKLTRILKTEYRDDVMAKRNRKINKKKPMPEVVTDLSVRGEDSTIATGREEVKLPPALLNIIESHAPGHAAPEKQETREQAEPPAHNRTSGENPHHFALTRAAQMALKTLPVPAPSDDRSEASTMALIDSIVKTSDDPALIDALQAMMVETSGQSVQQRETLALVAESIMEKKAAKEALQRAVLAESRLHESLKKCAPELSGDAAAVVAAAAGSDSVSTPVSNGPGTGTSAGFFNRINRSLTGNSQSHHRRIPFVKSKSKTRKSKNKDTNSKKDGEPTSDEDPVLKERNAASVSAGSEGTKEDPIIADPTLEPNQIPTEMNEEEVEVEFEEGRDDVEQAPEEREHIENNRSIVSAPELPPKRKNKYKHIASVQPETLIRFSRTTSRGSRTFEAGEQSTYVTGYTSKYTLGQGVTESEIEVVTSIEEAEDGTLVEVDEESESESEDSDDEEDHGDLTEVEADDPTISNFFDDDGEKIEYTIFELESKLSMSTYASSFVSGSSVGSSQSEDNDETENEDNDTKCEMEEEATACDEGTCDEATCDEATGDEATLNEGEDTVVSEAESGSEEESEEESDDDDDGLLFASFCQRPDSSFDVDASNDEDEEYNKKERRSRRSRRRQSRREHHEVPSILKCVSGYFAGDDVEVFVEEKKHKKRRHRKRRS